MTLTLRIEKVAHGGVFVARHEGQVYFVAGALDGELVEVSVTEKAKSYSKAFVTKVLEPSPHRVEHFWKAAKRGAGGAEFGHVAIDYQRKLKSQVLTEALARFANIELDADVEMLDGDSQDGLHYRTRVQLNVDETGLAGPSKSRSNEIVFTRDLPLAVPEIEELGMQLKNFRGIKKIKIAASNTGDLQWALDDKIQGSQQLIERVGGRTFRLSVDGFWQAHRLAAGELSAQVIQFAKQLNFDAGKPNLDLYSGAGLFSATMSNVFEDAQFTAVESNSKAVKAGERSASDLKNLKFVKADALKFLRQAAANSFDTIVLDPPRSGAAGKVTAELVRIRPRNIIYVACDPVALARDLKDLTAAGYSLQGLRAFDLFPHTHHFESVAALSLT